MARRSKSQQTAHNKRVASHAKQLDRKGWKVDADIPGWPQPSTVNGRRPDITATKSGVTRIVEVETDLSDDPRQHTAFRRHAGQKPNTHFYILIAGPHGGHATKLT